jgi:hypothetical protein
MHSRNAASSFTLSLARLPRLGISLVLTAAATHGSQTLAASAEPAQFGRVLDTIALDGRLDETSWTAASAVHTFFETYPRSTADPEVGTEVRFLYDDKYAYVGVTAHESDLTAIRSPFVRRDNVFADQDYVEIRLDPLGSNRTAAVFRSNAKGVITDGQFNQDEQLVDYEPDFDFDVRTAVDERAWTAELRIPLATLRYRAGTDQAWHFLVYRNRPRATTVTISNAPVPRSTTCELCFAARLTGFSIERPAPPVHVTPQVTYSHTDLADRFAGGVDAKWQIRPDTAVDVTIEPDFSQVEADDLQLTANARFSLSLAEKRPFFLEGADLLTSPINAIYTRTFADPTLGTRITHRGARQDYSALLLRDAGGGLLIEPGSLESQALPYEVESTGLVGRYKREIGATTWGLLTSARRHDDGSSNVVYGVDANWAPSASDRVGVQLLRSMTENPNRPDLLTSWNGQSFGGSAMALTWDHAVDRWYASLAHETYSQGFRAWNGFVPQVDVADTSFVSGVFFYPRIPLLVRVTPSLQVSRVRELGGSDISSDVAPSLVMSFPYETTVSIAWHPRAEDRTEAGMRTHEYFSALVMSTPAPWMPRARVTLSVGEHLDFTTGALGEATSVQATIPLRLFDRLELTAGIGTLTQDSMDSISGRQHRIGQDNRQLNALWHFSGRTYLQLFYQSSRITAGLRDDPARFRSDTKGASVILSYRLNWQTRFFVGLRQDKLSTGAGGLERSTQAFAKFSYLLSRR